MLAVKTNRPASSPSPARKYFYPAVILVVLVVIGIYILNVYRALQPATLPEGTVTISQSVLQEKYGLRVNLVAVTGAGGFIDLRLKIMDGEKAKLLLADAKNFPSLFTKNGVMLNAPEDTKSQKIEFITDGNLFILYPNSANAIQRGQPVTLVFGDIALEPINAR